MHTILARFKKIIAAAGVTVVMLSAVSTPLFADFPTVPAPKLPPVKALPSPSDTILSDGTHVLADGTRIYTNGDILYPAYTRSGYSYPSGTVWYADDHIVWTDGAVKYSDGHTVYPDGTVEYSNGLIVFPDGSSTYRDPGTGN